MTISTAQDRLLELALGGGGGDNATRRALVALIADALGFGRSGDSLTGRLLVGGATSGFVTTTGTTVATEYGDGINHITKLALTDFAVGTGADDADLAIGAQVYEFPAGDLVLFDSTIRGAFTSLASVTTIADGEYGMGTVVGSTAVDTLGEVGATAENIMTGQALSTYVADGASVVCHSTMTGDTPAGNGLIMRASGGLAHKLFLNVAATWPDVDAAAGLTFTGIITARWRKIS